MMWITPLLVMASTAVTVVSFTVVLTTANATVSSEPRMFPPFRSPAFKSVHIALALGMTWNFRKSVRATRAGSSSAVMPSAAKAAVKDSSVGASLSERGGHHLSVHPPVWPLSKPQSMCRAFLPQLLCPPCLLSSTGPEELVNAVDHTIAGGDIRSCVL